jgi:hypothetical protein
VEALNPPKAAQARKEGKGVMPARLVREEPGDGAAMGARILSELLTGIITFMTSEQTAVRGGREVPAGLHMRAHRGGPEVREVPARPALASKEAQVMAGREVPEALGGAAVKAGKEVRAAMEATARIYSWTCRATTI